MRACGWKAERVWVKEGDQHMTEFLACFLSYFAFSSLNVGEESVFTTFHVPFFFTTAISLRLTYEHKWYLHYDGSLPAIYTLLSALLPLR